MLQYLLPLFQAANNVTMVAIKIRIQRFWRYETLNTVLPVSFERAGVVMPCWPELPHMHLTQPSDLTYPHTPLACRSCCWACCPFWCSSWSGRSWQHAWVRVSSCSTSLPTPFLRPYATQLSAP